MYQDGRGGVYVSDDGKQWRDAQGKMMGGTVVDYFPLPRVCAGCDGAHASTVYAAAAAADPDGIDPRVAGVEPPPHCLSKSRGCFGNNTDIPGGNLPGGGIRLPSGTTDQQGIAACTAACGNLSTCAAWVYVANRGAMNGPRCAFKGRDYCPPIQHANTITGTLPGKETNATCGGPKPPPPGPPGPPPRPPNPSGLKPTHVHEAANSYVLVHAVEGGRDTAPVLTPVTAGGAHVADAQTVPGGPAPGGKCDHGQLGFPKSFWDPVKQRRLQYGWGQGPGLGGEEDATLPGGLSMKANHQSLIREVTYDPRLGMLCFLPVEETALLRSSPPLATISTATPVPAAGFLALNTPPNLANQSEVRVRFAVPTVAVTFGVRVMAEAPTGRNASSWLASPGYDWAIDFVPPPGVRASDGATSPSTTTADATATAAAYSVTVGPLDPSSHKYDNFYSTWFSNISRVFLKLDAPPNAPFVVLYFAPMLIGCGLVLAIPMLCPCRGCRPAGRLSGLLPLLTTDTEIELVVYVDHTVVEVYFAGGRYPVTSHVPLSLLRVGHGNNTRQGVEIFASGQGATVLNATVWRLGDIWDPATHGRPLRKPNY